MAVFHYLKSGGDRNRMEPDLSQRCTIKNKSREYSVQQGEFLQEIRRKDLMKSDQVPEQEPRDAVVISILGNFQNSTCQRPEHSDLTLKPAIP